jgi:ubiquinone/menaquinone biosynthesis C-methylase UbiE
MIFKDHFSVRSESYARYRPGYPSALYDFVIGLCEHRRTAWDCATGNGQAAVELARYYDHVIATDASANQTAYAMPHPRVEYRVATAEESGLSSASIDLVTVAQALHWFDIDRFFTEVRRVAATGAAIAVWSYGDPALEDPMLDDALQRFNSGTLASYWPRERHEVGKGYYKLPFPFSEVPTPSLTLKQQWTLEEFIGYIRTWSAVNSYRIAHGTDPVLSFEREINQLWTDKDTTRLVYWPLAIRAGKID